MLLRCSPVLRAGRLLRPPQYHRKISQRQFRTEATIGAIVVMTGWWKDRWSGSGDHSGIPSELAHLSDLHHPGGLFLELALGGSAETSRRLVKRLV